MEIHINQEEFDPAYEKLEADRSGLAGLDRNLSDTTSSSDAIAKFKERVGQVKELKQRYEALLMSDSTALRKTADELILADYASKLMYTVAAGLDSIAANADAMDSGTGLDDLLDWVGDSVQNAVDAARGDGPVEV